MTVQQGSFSTSDNCTISYTLHQSASPSAPRLALIHSLALDRTIWDGVVERLSDRATILTYDCRGHGRSGRPHMDYTVELFGRDLAELIDHLRWDRCRGGRLFDGGLCRAGLRRALSGKGAWADADRHQRLVWPGSAQTVSRPRRRGKGQRHDGLIDFQISRWFSEKFAASQPEQVNRVVKIFLANDFDCYAATCALLGDADLRKYLPKFRMPVAVVVGEEDYATPVAMAQALHAAIPQSTLKIIPGGRHLTPIQCPDEIAAEIAGLLERG